MPNAGFSLFFSESGHLDAVRARRLGEHIDEVLSSLLVPGAQLCGDRPVARSRPRGRAGCLKATCSSLKDFPLSPPLSPHGNTTVPLPPLGADQGHGVVDSQIILTARDGSGNQGQQSICVKIGTD